MKTIQRFGFFIVLLVVTATGCKKDLQQINTSETKVPSTNLRNLLNQGSLTGITREVANSLIPAEQNLIPANIRFCFEKVVPLCSKGKTIGSVAVKKGSDGKVYVTYLLSMGNYYFAALNLYTGTAAGIPLLDKQPNLCKFPYQKTFTPPYTLQHYTFVLNNQTDNFTVAAEALVMYNDKGRFRHAEIAWGDACTGQHICPYNDNGDEDNNVEQEGDHSDDYTYDNNHNNDDEHEDGNSGNCKGGRDATMFIYTGGACAVPSPARQSVEPPTCSKSVATFFGIDPNSGMQLPWAVPTVTVGNYGYTETEARAIGKVPDNYGNAQDSKYAFMRVATLKLSYTNYLASPTLAPAVATIESWLATVGKLSPTNLPTGNAAARSASATIDNWILLHLCGIRR
ncbi:MAG: hypothetical protein NVS1B13_23290 [Flavisolibacter sp.]